MNVDSAQAPQAADAVDQPQEEPADQKSDGPSAFSKLLLKSGKGKPAGEDIPGKPGAGPDAMTAHSPQTVTQIPILADSHPASSATSHTESLHAVSLPPQIEGVVREITAGVNAAGRNEVNIELNSKTLNGLQIHIEKHDGKIDVQFQSRTDDVARLLSRNVGALSQALADRGVAVNDIRIETPQAVPRTEEYKSNSRQQDSGRGGQGRGGQGRQQQTRQ